MGDTRIAPGGGAAGAGMPALRQMKPSGLMGVCGVDASLVVVTLAIYWQVTGFDLISFDDGSYVGSNARVQEGLGLQGVAWAFSTTHAANWHPLTWMSLMLDTTLWGSAPGAYHAGNLALHATNAVLLFHVFHRMTAGFGRSALVAALFAVHPLHVESVAWVSERKDVLSTMFLLLTIAAYVRYAQRPMLARYLPALLLFFLGLLAKPMLVTLPLLLLLLDWWPLGRLSQARGRGREAARLVLEKSPMLVLSALSAAATLLAQARGGTLSSIETLPLGARVGNALLSYLGYVRKALWPGALAFFYPHPGPPPPGKTGAALLVLAALTVLALLVARHRPYAVVGWFWYLGSLVPVIGVVQMGAQASADRYTYVPLIGLFLVLAWGAPGFLDARLRGRRSLAVVWLAGLAALSIIAFRQVSFWRDSVTLYRHALRVTSRNFLAHNNLGNVLLGQRRLQEATAEFQKALSIQPANAIVHYNLALALEGQGREQEAAAHYGAALLANPRLGEAHNNLGALLIRRGRQREAIEHFREALRINPSNTGARFHLAWSLQRSGLLEEALKEYRRVVAESPSDAEAAYNLGTVLAALGRLQEGLPFMRAAARLDPGRADARRSLERIQGEIERRHDAAPRH